MRILSFFLVLTLLGCDKEDHCPDQSELPICVTELLTVTDQTTYVQVEEWSWSGGQYYYLTAECCDKLNVLYDSNCDYICAPDGGFTGQGEGDCSEVPDSFERRVVWTRPE